MNKVLLVFRHLDLLVEHSSIYYYHQNELFSQFLLNIDAHEGRHNSMSHFAKIGHIQSFPATDGLIIYIVLLQVIVT